MAELLLAAAFAAGFSGFALLALSLQRHRRELAGATDFAPRRLLALRVIGHAALLVSFVLAVLREGPGFGSVLGILLLILSAMAVALTLSWRPEWFAAPAKALLRARRF